MHKIVTISDPTPRRLLGVTPPVLCRCRGLVLRHIQLQEYDSHYRIRPVDDWDENSLKEFKHRGCSSFYISIYRKQEKNSMLSTKLDKVFVDYITMVSVI